MIARAALLAAAAASGLIALVAPSRDVAPPHSRPIHHLLVIDNVSDFRAWKFFLGPRDLAHGERNQPFIPLEPADPAAASVQFELSGLNPLDFGFEAPRLYLAKRELLIDGMPNAQSRLVSAPLVEAERYVNARDPTRRRVTTYHVKSIAPLEVVLVSDANFDAVGLRSLRGFGLLLQNLVVTIAVELAVAALLLRRFDRRLVGTLVLVNLLTQPALTIVLFNEWIAGRLAAPLVEAAALLVEWPLEAKLLRISWRRAFVLAALTNLASFCVGLLL